MRTKPIAFLSIVNGIAFCITLLFWGLVFVKRAVPLPADVAELCARANAATTYGFMIGDIAISAPLLALAALGLWKNRFYGWFACQLANILWVYSMIVLWTRDFATHFTPGSFVFLPFTLVAAWALPYLWVKRKAFLVAQ